MRDHLGITWQMWRCARGAWLHQRTEDVALTTRLQRHIQDFWLIWRSPHFLKYFRKIISILWNFWSSCVSSSSPVSSASSLPGKESEMDHPNLNPAGSVDLQTPDAGVALFNYDHISKIIFWMILKRRCALSTQHSIQHHLRAPALTEAVRDPGKRSWSCAG